jgi:hypothetical protein
MSAGCGEAQVQALHCHSESIDRKIAVPPTEAEMKTDLLVLASDGTLYYAPAGTLRPVDDTAAGVAAAKQFMHSNAGKAIGVHAVLSIGRGVAAVSPMDGFMADAAKASRDPKP